MAKIHVHTAFTLMSDDATTKSFSPGLHEVADDVAEHWYVRLHTGEEPAPDLAPSDEQAINELSAELEAETERLAALESALDARGADLDRREAAIAAREADFDARGESGASVKADEKQKQSNQKK
ncbi:hypothetical protein NDK50_07930 [Paraburkholderia bryophila]|uniref:STY1053 family phage-associated protein n=1 Tax=Paraburkholderia bryophila TaxID=420952 RepID=UPI00234B9017|nr:hypothetical protein [Paraburkholderia bryophila]WCM21365.1 hypothetical protein NDK50_07930 [Paraburkholderia bryophila]